MQEEYYQLLSSGADIRRLTNEDREAMLKRHQESAASIVRRMILIEEVGRIEKIEVTDADLDKEIERMAEQQGRRALAMRAQLEAQKRLEAVRENLKAQKVADFLIAKAQVAYKPAAKVEAAATA
jgi:trigger factor